MKYSIFVALKSQFSFKKHFQKLYDDLIYKTFLLCSWRYKKAIKGKKEKDFKIYWKNYYIINNMQFSLKNLSMKQKSVHCALNATIKMQRLRANDKHE